MRGSRWKAPLEHGSYYLHDLQGLAVMGEAGEEEIIVEDRRGPGTAAGSDATDDAEKSDGRVSCLNKNAKKDQRDAMPGYEVYAKARPIMTLWRWVVPSLVFLVFGCRSLG